MYQNQPDPKVVAAEKLKKELQIKSKAIEAKLLKSSYCCSSNWRFYPLAQLQKHYNYLPFQKPE
jgi:YidC/Oxa1 family membrane protein insertase